MWRERIDITFHVLTIQLFNYVLANWVDITQVPVSTLKIIYYAVFQAQYFHFITGIPGIPYA